MLRATFLDIDPRLQLSRQNRVCRNLPGKLVDQYLSIEDRYNQESMASARGQKAVIVHSTANL